MSERITSEITASERTPSERNPDKRFSSERTFFSLRYTIPGYIFILILILVTLPKLRIIFTDIVSTDLIGIVLGFLLSGPPVGFLVSQIWYVLFKSDYLRELGFWRGLCLGDGVDVQWRRRKFLRERFNLRRQYPQELTFSNYIHTLLEGDPWRDYTERRFNLMHILGSSLFAILLSICISYIPMMFIFAIQGTTIIVVAYEIWLFIVILILAAYLLCSLRNIHLEHALASEVSIRKTILVNSFSKKDAKKIFPPEYFEEEPQNES